jgi:PAP2 superfamily protein
MRVKPSVVLLALLLAAVPAAAQTFNVNDLPPAPAANAQEPNPMPEHTGWATLAKDSGRDFVMFPKRKSTWVLLGIGGAAALAAHPADNYVERHVINSDAAHHFFIAGKIIGHTYTQVGAAVGLWIAGRYIAPPAADQPKTNKLSHLGFDLIRAQILSQALVHGVKYSVQRDRPTGECCSFPSGHAATAFAAAAVLERHFGNRLSWPALLGATYVATSRLVDNRHFLSDVIFGAAIGEASGWTVVGRHGRDQYVMYPMPTRGGMMIAVVRVAGSDATR